MTLESSALILAWAVLVMLALAVGGIMRQLHWLANSVPRERLVGQIPARVAAKLLPNGAKVKLLIFLAEECRACRSLLPDLASRTNELREQTFDVALVTAEPHTSQFGEVSLPVLEDRADLFFFLGVSVTPFAVVYSTDAGVVFAAPVGSAKELDVALSHAKARATVSGQIMADSEV